ncbi:SAC3 domain-containing protein 1 isoform X2 [Electrophorus electricus]|uniref:SAC3/GANP/THP3 conserved domain-containing protein n=1 Tax=Electrophorus electricus TaxID=8005 RepID=A0A4W4FJD7_ELEEL|nr:SAC3 domain-containing protein 1 isoform X2 [Electrophorus electricus]
MSREIHAKCFPSHCTRGGGRRQKQRCEGEAKSSVSVPRGTCMTMCPAYELRQRELQNRLHRFEVLTGTEHDRLPRADVSCTVKEYSRPAAGKDSTRATDLRPPDILLKTVYYLVDDIAASSTLHPWTEVYSFVFDRLRSVRQDMIIQRISGPECVAVLERTVRFLLFASYRLCGQPLRLFDSCINDTHLQECLSWLLECYREGQHQHQEEFQALSLLYNLGSAQAVQHVLELPGSVRLSPPVRLALAIGRAYVERNPVRLLRLARRLDFLQGCALHRHLLPCRRDLLLLYSHGHSSRNCRFPIQKLADILSLESSLTAQLCRAHGIHVGGEWVIFSKGSFTESLSEELQCAQMHRLLEDKQQDLTVSDIIHGVA